MFSRITVHVHTSYCIFYLLYVNGNAQNGCFLLLNGTQYARPKMAVRSTQCQNRVVRSTQGGREVSPSTIYIVGYSEKARNGYFVRDVHAAIQMQAA